jgi:GT2 family glycosyltransferase
VPGHSVNLIISILSLGRPENVLNQLADLPGWLDEFARRSGIASHIIIRNNDPNVDFFEVGSRISSVQAQYPSITCTLIADTPNNGFGEGHNGNIALCASDYVLILNDDIGFPHINWLGEAVKILQDDPQTVCVAATENPKYINPMFGNGVLPGSATVPNIMYAEASILLFDRRSFDVLGGFGADFRWAMCEDSDLSLRVQQHGWRMAHISMPHEHWRSTSFNGLPGAVKSSILEHNRAALFANWRETLTAGRVGRFEVFDLWSDGIGDVLCTLPHVAARLASLSPERRRNIVVNTSHPELFAWLGLDGIRVTGIADLNRLRAELEPEGIAAIRQMRDVNFSLPFNIHALLAGALGIDQADHAAIGVFAGLLRRLKLPEARRLRFEPGSYCVVHMEFERNHEGRALSLAALANLLEECGGLFDRIVLVGRERRLSAALFGEAAAEIVDLQGALSLSQLAAVIAHARFFVGIDSFPGHIAQACQVPSAVFFGAIHPLARSWNDRLLWPLVAKLDCIGCYHSHLEPSVPFCMRRDVACTIQLAPAAMARVLSEMIAGQAFDWSTLRLSLQALQARLIKLVRYHPAPPERLFRGQLHGNEQISNQIYRITEQMGGMLRDIYHTSTVKALTGQVQDLQATLFSARVSLDEAFRALRERGHDRQIIPPALQTTNRILQLNGLTLTALRCRSEVSDQWIEVDATDEDPQLHLPLLQGGGGKVQLRLSWISEAPSPLQVHWAIGDDGFSAEQVHTAPAADGMQTANVSFDVPEGEQLLVRIDPTTGAGKSRLRGSLAGLFELLGDERSGATSVLSACEANLSVCDTAAKKPARALQTQPTLQPPRAGRRGRSKAGA